MVLPIEDFEVCLEEIRNKIKNSEIIEDELGIKSIVIKESSILIMPQIRITFDEHNYLNMDSFYVCNETHCTLGIQGSEDLTDTFMLGALGFKFFYMIFDYD